MGIRQIFYDGSSTFTFQLIIHTPTIAITNPCTMAVPNIARYVIKTSHPNPSLQVTADNQIKMVEAPVEKPGPGHVLLHIKTTGICG